MKLSKKRKILVKEAIQNAFQSIFNNDELFDRNEVDCNPETWQKDTQEKFDMLTEMQREVEFNILEILEK